MSSVLVLGAVFVRRDHLGSTPASARLSIAAGAMDSLANLAFLLAVRRGDLAIVSVITALYPAATVILARAILHERLHRMQVVGLAIAAAAVALLATA